MEQTQSTNPSRLSLIVAAVIIVIVAALSAAVLFQPGRQVSGYEIDIPPSLAPHMNATTVAGIAVQYLDRQTAHLASPDLHLEPRVGRVAASLAADVRALEPAVRPQTALAQPARLVWVVFADGDFLNVGDLEWSSAGTPARSGTIVVDDATATIIGVYPHSPPAPHTPPARPTPRPTTAVASPSASPSASP